MFASAFGCRANVENTADDIFCIIKKQKVASKNFPRGYIATGQEGTHYKDNVRFMQKYQQLGLGHAEIQDHGAHNWEYCDKQVKKFIDWLQIENAYRSQQE